MKTEKKILKKQLSKLIKSARKGDTKAAKILLAIKGYKTRQELKKENNALRTGMVINNGNIFE